jgi:hypothetical protein
MNVFELIRELSQCDPESEVRIVVAGRGFGRTPSVGIPPRGVSSGIDWDNGEVLIRPETK